MTGYCCYFLDRHDRIDAAVNFEADQFDEAVERALAMLRARSHHHAVELWQESLRLYSSREEPPRHQCYVYGGAPSKTLRAMASMIDRKLRANIRVLYINSPPMVAGIRSYLASIGVEVEKQVESGALILSSEQSHLVEGRFDAELMLATLEGAVENALTNGYGGLWATGDMTWELGPHRDLDRLVNYELGLEEVFRRQPHLSGVCQYHADTLPRDLVRQGAALHGAIFLNETLSRLNPRGFSPSADGGGSQLLQDAIDDLCTSDAN